MLTPCRSTSSAYFSKDKNEKKCQRHLNFLKSTHLQRDQEAIATLLTSLAQLSGLKLRQPLTSVSPFICILGSCYFKGHSELSVWRTCPEIFQGPQGWSPCHSRGAAGGEVLAGGSPPQGRANPFGVFAHFGGTVEATELSPSGEPAPGTDSTAGPTHLLLRRGWFPLQCFLPTSCIRSEERSLGGGGGGHFHTPGTGMPPTLPASRVRQRSSGEVPRSLSGASVFSGSSWFLFLCY